MTMASGRPLLEDIDVFCASGLDERVAALHELCKHLGPDWSPGTPTLAEDSLPLRHLPTGLDFVAVPGGEFEMGLTEEDLRAASYFADWTVYLAEDADSLRKDLGPPRRVRVAPFLVARRLLSTRDAGTIQMPRGALERRHLVETDFSSAIELASNLSLRLPSEAEIEWCLRDGGRSRLVLGLFEWYMGALASYADALRSRFGLDELDVKQWAVSVRDDPRDSAAPGTARPGDDGVIRSGGFGPVLVSDVEVFGALPGRRYRHPPAAIRLCAR
ncbi:uncharacterized protein SOCE26_050900 [Sorangium cellulosum]|uniref:Uncharacterized protein n=1 Tax=Sorangium cellulosum TaxID=56 RepID=A0A2L0EWF8_SORCE|nr:hypothetical protein [Sorangium cellulosum]AUX43638.1 uncharacterized protein SOCE26_050900 [Sorangium cellulosum]